MKRIIYQATLLHGSKCDLGDPVMLYLTEERNCYIAWLHEPEFSKVPLRVFDKWDRNFALEWAIRVAPTLDEVKNTIAAHRIAEPSTEGESKA